VISQKYNNDRVPNLIKWAGGKTSYIDYFLKTVPKDINTYYEPFFGGGALFWRLRLEEMIKNSVISDLNTDLINLLLNVKNDPYNLSISIDKYRNISDSDGYYNIRKEFNSSEWEDISSAEKSAIFLYLNRNCYNGLWRVNKSGKFNVPKGSYKNYFLPDLNTVLFYSELLKNVTIRACDFSQATKTAKKGDFVYLDPPYFKTKSSQFDQYTKDTSEIDMKKSLVKSINRLHKKEVNFMISNRLFKGYEAFFKNFDIEFISSYWPINSKSNGRILHEEILVKNF
jgi:DNA adenine methylase